MIDPAVHEVRRFLRSHLRGALRFDEHLREIRYCFAPDGRLVAPAMVAMLHTPDTVLFVPDYAEDSLELQVTLEEFPERGEGGALADRWRIHHGEPEDVRWAFFHIDGGKWQDMVFDDLALTMPNLLAASEPALCREFNQVPREELAAIVHRACGVRLEEPTVVAVDEDGLLVRGRFEVKRVFFPATAPDAEKAMRAFHAMRSIPA